MVPARILSSAEEGRKSDFYVKVEPRELEEVKVTAGLNNASEDNVSGIFNPLVNLMTVDDDLDLLNSLKTVSNDIEGEEVDVIKCSGSSETQLMKNEDPDATECSSSFDESFESDNESNQEEWSDFEGESPFPASNGDSTINDRFSMIFKKKKLTAEWMKYVYPLTWRCRWLELHVKDLKLRASKYDKKLTSYKREKELQSKMVEIDSSVSRSVPVAYHRNHNKVMRRKRRNRSEEEIDVSSYASNHVFFSYYENKRTETDGHSVDDDCGDVAEENIKGNDDNEWLRGSKDNDCHVEELLLNIDTIQSRVLKLKAYLNKVICRNTKDISSSHGNLLSVDLPASYVHNASGSPRNNGDTMIAGLLMPSNHVSEYEMDDVAMTESAVSSYGDAADLDIIGNTIDILARDVIRGQHHVGNLCRDSEDDVLINNQVAEEEYQSIGKLGHATGTVQASIKKEDTHSEDESSAPNVAIPRPVTSRATDSATLQTVLNLGCYTGKKRGRKPKKRRLTPVVAAGSSGSGGPWRSERLLKKRGLQRKRT